MFGFLPVTMSRSPQGPNPCFKVPKSTSQTLWANQYSFFLADYSQISTKSWYKGKKGGPNDESLAENLVVDGMGQKALCLRHQFAYPNPKGVAK
jgi:hypothetical protein